MAEDITRQNLADAEEVLLTNINSADFISIDTEFSGLGTTSSKNLEERYELLLKVIQDHALVSMGVSLFHCPNGLLGEGYKVQNFNFLLLCQKEYKVSPQSLLFLVENGFDFNRQIKQGISYIPGNDIPDPPPKGQRHLYDQTVLTQNKLMRKIFNSIISSGKPLIIHNGLLDLMFLYNSFFAELPSQFQVFVADCTSMFKGGIYDTKYIAEYEVREKASYLPYLYKKFERKEGIDKISFDLQHNLQNMNEDKIGPPKDKICQNFAMHGYCKLGRNCQKSHDIDQILDMEETEEKRIEEKEKRKKRKMNNNGNENLQDKIGDVQSKEQEERFNRLNALNMKDHSAAFDSFMTGFVFLSLLKQHQKQTLPHQTVLNTDTLIPLKNKLYLSGKNVPLLLVKSGFTSTSENYNQKIK